MDCNFDLVSVSYVFLWIVREVWKEKGTFSSIQGMKLDEAEVVWGLPAVKCGTRNRLLYLHF